MAIAADDPGADLDRLTPQADQRPVLGRFGCCQGSRDVAEIVSEILKLKHERVGRQWPA